MNVVGINEFSVFLLFSVFVNRSLMLEKVKFYGFDMDYTLACEYTDQTFRL